QRRAVVGSEGLFPKAGDRVTKDGERVSDLVRDDGGELSDGGELLLGGKGGLGGAKLVVRVHELARAAAELSPSRVKAVPNVDMLERQLGHQARDEGQKAVRDEVA